MANDNQEDDQTTVDEMLESVKLTLDDVEDRVRNMADRVDDAAAGLRLEIAQNRREMVELRATVARLQGRVDNQLTTLVIANIASGLGVAALVLGASRAL